MLQRALYDHCEEIDRLALAHSCVTYQTIRARAERRRKLRWGDIELNVRNPQAGAYVTTSFAKLKKDGGGMIALPEPRPATDLQRDYVIHPHAELSLYMFEEYRRPAYIPPDVWHGDPNSWLTYTGVKTPSGCVLKSAASITDSVRESYVSHSDTADVRQRLRRGC